MSDEFWARPDGSTIADEWLGGPDFVGAAMGEDPEGLTDAIGSAVRNTKVPPYSQVCHVFSRPRAAVDFGFPGSGFLFGRAVMITAAHLLFDIKSQAWFEEIEIAPGRAGDTFPFGRAKVRIEAGSAVVPEAWVKAVKAARGDPMKVDRNHDYGIVRLSGQAISAPGSLGIASMSAGPSGMKILLPSYAFTSVGNGHMKAGKGTIGDTLAGSLRHHDAPGGKGASGAPLIILDRQGKPGDTVYAMHVAEDKDGHPVALEFSDQIYANISAWATS